MSDMKKIAERIKKDHEVNTNKESAENTILENTEEVEPTAQIDDDDDVAILVDENIVESNSSEKEEGEEEFDDGLSDEDLYDGVMPSDSSADLDYEDINTEFEITNEMIQSSLPDVPLEAALPMYDSIRSEVINYRRSMIIQKGLSPDEANAIALNRLEKVCEKRDIEYIKENPSSVSVVIDKRDVDKLEFSNEEKAKLMKTKVINLKTVETKEVPFRKIKKIDKNRKNAYVQTLESAISTYSVPLPIMCDYVTFKGSQIVQLLRAVRYEDATYDEVVSQKASFVYTQLLNGQHFIKTKERGKVDMTFTEFMNNFSFHDLDMALYGILVASSLEETEAQFTCPACNNPFTWKYNIKSILNGDGFQDEIKQRIDDIISHKSNPDYLKDLYNEQHKLKELESPITKNVYTINYPSIGRVIDIYRIINQDDESMLYLSAAAIFIDNMLIYDKRNDEYIPIDEEETGLLFEVLQKQPQEEIDILLKCIQPLIYVPKFTIKTKCNKCGESLENNVSVEDLIFLRARDSSTQIES